MHTHWKPTQSPQLLLRRRVKLVRRRRSSQVRVKGSASIGRCAEAATRRCVSIGIPMASDLKIRRFVTPGEMIRRAARPAAVTLTILMASRRRMLSHRAMLSSTSVTSRRWENVTHLSIPPNIYTIKANLLKGTRRQRQLMLATARRVSRCAIHSLTDQSNGVSHMEAPSTRGLC